MSNDAPISQARSKIARWIEKLRLIAEVNSLDAASRAQLMSDLQLSPAEFDQMATLSLSSEGLERVLDLLGMDRAELEREAPRLMSDLRRNCRMCKDWKECRHDLDAGEFSHEVEDYCVNRDILRKLTSPPN